MDLQTRSRYKMSGPRVPLSGNTGMRGSPVFKFFCQPGPRECLLKPPSSRQDPERTGGSKDMLHPLSASEKTGRAGPALPH